MRTPWGAAQEIRTVADGIEFVSTASHGGYKLSRKRNAKVPEYMHRAGGWYEEDCESAIVMVVFPELFPANFEAMKTLRNWFPNEYEQFTGIFLKEGESHERDDAIFLERHKNSFLTIAAWGDWHERVPKGMVGVYASIGGIRTGTGRYFLVTSQEYDDRHLYGMVIDPAKHREVFKSF